MTFSDFISWVDTETTTF